MRSSYLVCYDICDDKRLRKKSRRWQTATPYAPTRHARRSANWDPVVEQDLAHECRRRGLPHPRVLVRSVAVGPRGGAEVEAELEFPSPQSGPIFLGRTAHAGGGRFVPVPAAR